MRFSHFFENHYISLILYIMIYITYIQYKHMKITSRKSFNMKATMFKTISKIYAYHNSRHKHIHSL